MNSRVLDWPYQMVKPPSIIKEIAAAVLFFASNGSDMITGADLMIDGGFTIW